MDYKEHPRPDEPYYEVRHNYLTQGDILREVPWAQLGPSIVVVDPTPEGEPVPEGTLPVLSYVAFSPFGMVLSDTCDFRHPPAKAIDAKPKEFDKPGAVYHSGYLRVAPIFPLDYWEQLPKDKAVLDEFRQFDQFRKLMYLPGLDSAGLPESAVGLHMADSLHIDLVLRLDRVTQLKYVARQQLNFKLVRFDTGFWVPRHQFEPDLE